MNTATEARQLEFRDHLRHMLGAGSHIPRGSRGYRNYFCASVGGYDHIVMQEMEAAGLVRAAHTINQGKSQYFVATLAGCQAIGLGKAATRRALDSK